MGSVRRAKFRVGQVVRHRVYPFRGIIFDIDPVFNNTEEWWQSIPADVRPRKDQPFYHLLAENAETEYIAYVSEQNLLPDASGAPLRHPQVGELFTLERRRQLPAPVPAAAALSSAADMRRSFLSAVFSAPRVFLLALGHLLHQCLACFPVLFVVHGSAG